MKKVFLAICIAAISVTGYSQSGNNQIGVGADAGIPMGDFGDTFKAGFGGYLKGLYGVGSAGQITFTAGYTSFGMKDEIKDALGVDKATISIIPLLAGYRHNFSGFYVEPQVGYGIFNAKAKEAGISASNSDGAFTWAAGIGFAKSGFDGGVRYQSSSKDGSSDAFIGIHIGYNFSLGGNK